MHLPSAVETPLDPRRKMRHRQPGLDLLRALAIIFVLLYHAGLFGFTLPWRIDRYGWIGVDLFFVLSGYLIGGQLLASLSSRLHSAYGSNWSTTRLTRDSTRLSLEWVSPRSRSIALRSGTVWRARHGGFGYRRSLRSCFRTFLANTISACRRVRCSSRFSP